MLLKNPKMKKYIIILMIAFLATGCSDDLDNILPKNAISESQLNDNDIGKLRNGVYASVESGVIDFALDFDVRADNFRGGPGFSLVDPVNTNPSDPALLSLWRSAYRRIKDINFLIESIDRAANQTALLQTYKGEALYFRGLMYHNLVTRWGGVPILTQTTVAILPRSTEAQVWQLIKDDLTAAELLLPNFTNKFFVSKQAAQALLARVYLANNDKPNANIYADKVINYGTATTTNFALATDANGYATNFISNTTSKEIVFAFINNNAGSRKLFYDLVNDVDPTWNYSPSLNLFANLYANGTVPVRTGDKRRTAVFSTDNTRIIKFPNGRSGQQLVTTANANFTPIVVSRFPEMYLVKAEALGVGAAAETTLAPYFTARYTVAPAAGTIAALSASAFQSLILDERHREFYGEGYRWHDIKRTNRLDLLPSIAGRNYLLYYPIPQNEILLGNYTQNPLGN